MIQGPIRFRTSNSLPVSRSYFLWSATSCLASMEIESGTPTTSTSFLHTINPIDSHPCIPPLLGKNHPKRHPADWNHLSDTAGKRLNMRIFTNDMEAGKLSNDPGTGNPADNNHAGHWHSLTACLFRRCSTLCATMPPESNVRATLQLL